MKSLIFLLNLAVLSACVPSKTVEPDASAGKTINASAPYLWSAAAFPLDLGISDGFTDTAAVTNINDMSNAWETAVENKLNFFNLGSRPPEVSAPNMNLDALGSDGIFGVYRITHWPMELNSGALAVTQLFGRRYNIGTPSEYVRIEHADILINENLYDFRTGNTGTSGSYDLQTVVLHEVGHFLGLGHKSGNTVMVPSIGTSTQSRIPTSVDAVDMATKYGVSLSTSSSSQMVKGDAQTYSPAPGDSGQKIKILIEVTAEGECLHKENGILVGRHSFKAN